MHTTFSGCSPVGIGKTFLSEGESKILASTTDSTPRGSTRFHRGRIHEWDCCPSNHPREQNSFGLHCAQAVSQWATKSRFSFRVYSQCALSRMRNWLTCLQSIKLEYLGLTRSSCRLTAPTRWKSGCFSREYGFWMSPVSCLGRRTATPALLLPGLHSRPTGSTRSSWAIWT